MIYSIVILFSQFWISQLFHVCFYLLLLDQHTGFSGRVVWYSRLSKNFPQFAVIHTVKGFSVVDEAYVNVFLGLFCFLHDSTNVGNLISGSSIYFIYLFILILFYF